MKDVLLTCHVDLEWLHVVSRAAVLRLVEAGDLTRVELVTLLSVRSDQIPLLDCLLQFVGAQ